MEPYSGQKFLAFRINFDFATGTIVGDTRRCTEPFCNSYCWYRSLGWRNYGLEFCCDGTIHIRYGIPVELGIILWLICGTGCGFINGWLVAVMRLPPFIVTLGMWQILLATTFIYSNESIRAQDIEEQAVLLHYFAQKYHCGVNFTYGALFAVILAFGLAYTLRTTAWGRHVFAVGDDPEAAELSGVNEENLNFRLCLQD